jgi:hypothetical protein
MSVDVWLTYRFQHPCDFMAPSTSTTLAAATAEYVKAQHHYNRAAILWQEKHGGDIEMLS